MGSNRSRSGGQPSRRRSADGGGGGIGIGGVRTAFAAVLLALSVQILLRSSSSSSGGGIDLREALSERRRRESTNSGYDLRPTRAPRLAGLPLRIFARTLRLPLIGTAVLRKMVEGDNDVGWVRRFEATLDAEDDDDGGGDGGDGMGKGKAKAKDPRRHYPPLYYPAVPLSSSEMERHVAAADGFDIVRFAEDAPGRTAAATAHPKEADGEEADDRRPFVRWTVDDYTSRYKSGALAPTDAIRRVLAAIRSSDSGPSPLGAFLSVNETDALEQARASAERYRTSSTLGPLDGVPIGVKDELDVAGHYTTDGTSFFASQQAGPARYDSVAVARVRAAGMVIVGKTAMHEIGIGTTGHNPHHGTPHNPYGPGTHYPGGSSSGSASAVSAGLVPVALGADGGGSIRVPSSLCGVVGLKGTWGRVPHPKSGAASLTHVGPIAGSVKDAALLYMAVAGPLKEEEGGGGVEVASGGVGVGVPGGVLQPPPYITLRRNLNGDRPLDGLRVGVFGPWFDDAVPAVVNACRSALDYFVARGAEVVNVTIPHLEAMKMSHAVTILTEMTTSRSVHWDNVTKFSLDAQVKMSIGRSLSSRDFLAAQRVRSYAVQMLRDVFQTVDVIATPATATAAPRIPPDAVEEGDSNVAETMALMRYVAPGNLAGIPGIVFPVGYDNGIGGGGGGDDDDDGNSDDAAMPIGMQLMSWQWEEDVLFRAAKVAEGMMDERGEGTGGARRPREYYDVLGGEWDAEDGGARGS